MATQADLAAVGTGGWQDEQGIRHPGFLHLIDLSAPSAPRIVGSLDVDGMISAISLAGPYALIALGPALKLVDISNPALPRVIASLEKPGRTFSDICRVGGLWLAAESFEGLHILRMFPSARLEAQRQGNTLRLDWPETAMGLELQRSDRATGGSWIPVAGSTSVRSAIEPVSGGSVLYRLVPPW
jgi:hypothetical protein